MLRPTIVTLVLLVTLLTLADFALVYIMTQGGPGTATDILPVYSYQQAFSFNNLAYGALIGDVMVIIATVLGFVYVRVRRWHMTAFEDPRVQALETPSPASRPADRDVRVRRRRRRVSPLPRPPAARRNLLLAAVGIAFLLPMLWMVAASLDSNASWSIEWPHFTLANFQAAMGPSALLTVEQLRSVGGGHRGLHGGLHAGRICAVPAADPWKGPMLLVVLFLSGIPMSILIVPIYQMFATENWLSNLPTAIFLGVTSPCPLIWLIKNFMDSIPYDLEEAARISTPAPGRSSPGSSGRCRCPGSRGRHLRVRQRLGVVRRVAGVDQRSDQQPVPSRSTGSSGPPTSATETLPPSRCCTPFRYRPVRDHVAPVHRRVHARGRGQGVGQPGLSADSVATPATISTTPISCAARSRSPYSSRPVRAPKAPVSVAITAATASPCLAPSRS